MTIMSLNLPAPAARKSSFQDLLISMMLGSSGERMTALASEHPVESQHIANQSATKKTVVGGSSVAPNSIERWEGRRESAPQLN